MRRNIDPILLLLLIIIPLTRIVLTISSGTLYSTDIWPLYKSSKILVDNPYKPLYDDKFFDGYNNHWPGVILYTSITSKVFDIDLFNIYVIMPIFMYFMVIVSIYLILDRMNLKRINILMLLLYYSMIPSLALFSSALLKEVFALPIFLLVLYVIFFNRGGKSIYLVIMLFSCILLSSILSSYLLIGVLISSLYIAFVYRIKDPRRNLDLSAKSPMIYSLTLTLMFILYMLLYGFKGVPYRIEVYEVYTYIVYMVFIYLTYLFYGGIGGRRVIILVLFGLSISLFAINILYVNGIIIESIYLLPYVLPILVGFPILFINGKHVFVRSFALFISLNVLYVLFGAPMLITLLHRFLNYLPLLIILSIPLSGLTIRRLYKLFTITIVLLSVFSGTYVLGKAVDGGDPITYFWHYDSTEVEILDDVKRLIDGGVVVGDDKVMYYYWMELDVKPHLYLLGIYGSYDLSGKPLVIYKDNFVYGLSIGLNRYQLSSYYNRYLSMKIFDGGIVYVVMGYGRR